MKFKKYPEDRGEFELMRTDHNEEERLGMDGGNCIYCEGKLESLYHTEEHGETGYHYMCRTCRRGFYIADLAGIVTLKLRGLSDKEIIKTLNEKELSKGVGA